MFVHAAQSLNDGQRRWVTTDISDTDENHEILEHGDVITEWVGELHAALDDSGRRHRTAAER